MDNEVIKKSAQQILGLIDLTSLNNDDTIANIDKLCEQARTHHGNVAAICIYPQFIKHARVKLNNLSLSNLPIATVVNFPSGNESIENVSTQTTQAIHDGADEIDLVVPYQDIIQGNLDSSKNMVHKIAQICHEHNVILKVIIESGVLQQEELIRQASLLSIENGADFIKTSTGKVAINATLQAATIMLSVIRDTGGKCGFKAAGGVRLTSEAMPYLEIARELLGDDYVKSQTFRFGASSLLSDVLAVLDDKVLVTQNPLSY